MAQQRIMRQLRKIMPGEATCIGAVVDDNGHVHAETSDIAAILKAHWEKVFLFLQNILFLLLHVEG